MEDGSPFLGHRVIEFAFEICGNTKIRECSRKVVAPYLMAVPGAPGRDGPELPRECLVSVEREAGEFDRRSYNERCMSIWRCVFFSGEGGVGLWNDGRKLTPLVHPEGNRSESLILRKGIAPFRPAVIIRLDAGWAWNGTETKRDCQRLS